MLKRKFFLLGGPWRAGFSEPTRRRVRKVTINFISPIKVLARIYIPARFNKGLRQISWPL